MSYNHMGGPCPRCGSDFDSFPALSRADNKTYICSKCGTGEALYDWAYKGQQELTPVDQPVMTETEVLAEALFLAIVAPSEEKMLAAVGIAAQLWDTMPEIDIQRAKRMAEQRAKQQP